MRFLATLEVDGPAKDATRSLRLDPTRYLTSSWSRALGLGKLALWLPTDEKTHFVHRKFEGQEDKGYVLIGLAFRKTNDEEDPDLDLSPLDFQRVIETNGSHLCSHFWGQYVFFGYDLKAQKYLIVRDPTGMIPCYEAERESGRIFFSDLRPLREYFGSFVADQGFVKSVATGSLLDRVGSGIQGVSEIYPGASLSLEGTKWARHQCWDPYQFASRTSNESFVEASRSVRFTVRKVVRSIARRFDNIAIAAGGLDSSVVLSCLSGDDVTCDVNAFTYSTTSQGGDEYHYTKAVADFLEQRLDRYTLRAENIDFELVMSGNDQPKPDEVFEFGDLAAQPDMSRYSDAQALFTGAGGDTLFLQSPGTRPVVDWLHSENSVCELYKTLKASIYESQRPPWAILNELYSAWRHPRTANEIVHQTICDGAKKEWYSDLAIESSLDTHSLNPALLTDAIVPESKALQIIRNCFSPINPFSHMSSFNGIPNFHIYVAQPLLELCLSIAPHHFVHQGIDRALMRHAFRDDLPEILLRRATKGSPGQVYTDFIRLNVESISKRLRSGFCDRSDLISDEMRSIFSDTSRIGQIPSTTLLGFLNIESWANSHKFN